MKETCPKNHTSHLQPHNHGQDQRVDQGRNGLKYCRTRKVPLLKAAHGQGRLKFANEHLNDSKEDWETGCSQMRPKSSSLASTLLAAFGGGRMLNMTPSPPSSMEVETLCFGAVSLPRVQDDSTASRGL